MEPLDPVAVRVLGSLMEKEVTVPDNYPLTLNSLLAACNQTTNREPVMSLTESAVADSVKDLMRLNLVREVVRSDSRTKRFRQSLSEVKSLHPPEAALLCVLMLRGAQTTGELRSRTARMFEFADLRHVEVTLQALMTLDPPLVREMTRRPGQKETRYAHLLAGEPVEEPVTTVEEPQSGPTQAERLEMLERTVESLQSQMEELRTRFEEFRREFQ